MSYIRIEKVMAYSLVIISSIISLQFFSDWQYPLHRKACTEAGKLQLWPGEDKYRGNRWTQLPIRHCFGKPAVQSARTAFERLQPYRSVLE